MCLSTVILNSGTKTEEVMKDVARMEAQGSGFLLIGLLGEEKFVSGRLKSIDFVEEHKVVLEKLKNWLGDNSIARG